MTLFCIFPAGIACPASQMGLRLFEEFPFRLNHFAIAGLISPYNHYLKFPAWNVENT